MERIQEANDYARQHQLRPFMVSSLHFALGEQMEDPHGGGCISMAGHSQRDLREWHRQQKMPLLTGEKGVSVAQIALAYDIHYSDICGYDIFALVGGLSADEVKNNVQAVDLVLSHKEMVWLEKGGEDK